MTRPTAEEIAAKSKRNRAARTADPRKADAYPSERLETRFKKVPETLQNAQGEHQSICLTLPYPPSVNHYWLPNFNHSKRISDKGNHFRTDVMLACSGHIGIKGHISVSVIANPPDRRKRDLDNIFKALLDALTHAGMIEDDGLIDRLSIERGEVFDWGQVRVTIEPML